jgi:hypothetical protein
LPTREPSRLSGEVFQVPPSCVSLIRGFEPRYATTVFSVTL